MNDSQSNPYRSPVEVAQRPRTPSATLVGILSLTMATLGLASNASSTLAVIRGIIDPSRQINMMPYFNQAFFVMLPISVVCDSILLVCGIDLVSKRLRSARVAIFLFLFEIVYLFLIVVLCLEHTLGRSIAEASLVNTGLFLQFMVLLPLWGPIVLRRAIRKGAAAAASAPAQK